MAVNKGEDARAMTVLNCSLDHTERLQGDEQRRLHERMGEDGEVKELVGLFCSDNRIVNNTV